MINREIKADKVNVVNAENKGLTLMSLDDAIALAEQTEEDEKIRKQCNSKCNTSLSLWLI